ncbi:MAG TPA: DNA gyrase inhibitor YacG [Candidatus Binataceae bacterium]|nr:DNA gyrase inhibitor YacG [Candidatus Binataceae bacterium]
MRTRMTRCPICKKPAERGPANRFRPFCSERCQMVDLGTWAGEEYRVPGGKIEDREHPDDRANGRRKIRDSGEQ